MLHLVSMLILTSAGALFVLCIVQWSRGLPPDEAGPALSVIERFQKRHSAGVTDDPRPIPLIKEAEAFALYLTPPQPRAVPAASVPQAYVPPAIRPPSTTPQFVLLSTSYCHSGPEKSLALISEPGAESRWIGKGACVGYLVVERIDNGAMVYRDGSQSREMRIARREAVPLARLKAAVPGSTENIRRNGDLWKASPSSGCGLALPDGPPVARKSE